MNMRAAHWEDVYRTGYTGPVTFSLLAHIGVFLWNPTMVSQGTLKPSTEFMQVRYLDKLPEVPKVEIPKPPPKKEIAKKKPPKAKKSGLSLAKKPDPIKVTQKPPKPTPKPFVSKIEMPKYTPRALDQDIMAASPSPGLAMPSRQRVQQAAVPAPRLQTKSRGLRASDLPMKLTDRGISGRAMPSVIIPVGDERGDQAILPPAAVLAEAPRGIRTVQGARRPGAGTGSGELVGKSKSGYFGSAQAPTYVSGDLSGGSGRGTKVVSGKGFEIGGPIGDRRILKRRLPEYPAWAEEKGITAIVQIFFTVRPDGSIRTNMRVDRSSGYPELDQLAKEALTGWKFSATGASSGEDTAWGVITFRFTLA